MFHLVESGKVSAPLNLQDPKQPNMDFISEFVGNLLKQAFPHLTIAQIRVTVKGFFSFNTDTVKFKEHLRDFLVQIKTYVGEDTSDLFLEEREKDIQDAQVEKQKVHREIPGMLNPYELQEDSMKD